MAANALKTKTLPEIITYNGLTVQVGLERLSEWLELLAGVSTVVAAVCLTSYIREELF